MNYYLMGKHRKFEKLGKIILLSLRYTGIMMENNYQKLCTGQGIKKLNNIKKICFL